MSESSTSLPLTDTELLNALHEAASNLSYFNAAEGDVWRAETGARAAAQKEWNILVNEAIHRNIYNKEDFAGRYLV
jgi:hypothetical protein